MVRPLCAYFTAAASLLLLIGLFLPAGRGVEVLHFANGQIIETQTLAAEEMGCIVLPPFFETSNVKSVYSTDDSSFISGSGALCGKSPLSMATTGRYFLPNLLLLVPAPLALFALYKICKQPFARNADKTLMLIMGIISIVMLLAWWAIWVKFRVIPAVGFWISFLGALLLLSAGIFQQPVDAFAEKRHPHPA